MKLTAIQLDQLRNYRTACIELDRFMRGTPEPAPGAARSAYWSERADLEEHVRNMFHAFQSSLTWGAA